MVKQEVAYLDKAKKIVQGKNITELRFNAASLCAVSVRAMVDHYWVGTLPKKGIETLRKQLCIAERYLISNIH